MDNQEKIDLANYQVVRQEFVDDAQEVYFTFNMGKAYINSYGLLFNEDYVQIYVDQERKNMVIKPLIEKKKDSFRWSGTGKKRKPRHMRCAPLYMLVFMMMDWDIYSRYRITGYIEENGEEKVLYFDLKNAVRFKNEEEKEMTLRLDRSYPEEWRNSFGSWDFFCRFLLSLYKGQKVQPVRQVLLERYVGRACRCVYVCQAYDC